MKEKLNKFYLLVFLCLSQFISTAQSYTHFPDSNAYWSQAQTYNDGTQIIENIYTLFMDGDTIVNGITYHKLFGSGIENTYTLSWSLVNSFTYNHESYPLIREDSLKHIYKYRKSTGVDDLVYDFNLQLNDTLDYLAYPFVLEPGTYVSSIDSVLVGLNYRKRFHLSVPNLVSDYISLVEGIGSSFGLFDFTGPPFEQSRNLFCFRSDEGNYILDTFNCRFVGIDEHIINNSITLFPNPSTGQISIKIAENINSNLLIKIYNQLNMEVFSKSIEGYNEKIFQLPLILPNGVYFILIKYKNQMKYVKYLVV